MRWLRFASAVVALGAATMPIYSRAAQLFHYTSAERSVSAEVTFTDQLGHPQDLTDQKSTSDFLPFSQTADVVAPIVAMVNAKAVQSSTLDPNSIVASTGPIGDFVEGETTGQSQSESLLKVNFDVDQPNQFVQISRFAVVGSTIDTNATDFLINLSTSGGTTIYQKHFTGEQQDNFPDRQVIALDPGSYALTIDLKLKSIQG